MEPAVATFTSEELLGPLNEVEKKHAVATLYIAGDRTFLDAPRVAIVGTRKPSDMGQARARRLARFLAENGIVVVSGLAAGVDTIAHETAIAAGGKTIAVLGTPLDDCYPRANRGLQDQIMREHLAVSQFPSGCPVQRKNFPQRNRTMALIADASVIIEAGDGSGTLSQGWEALRLGRPLFVLRSLLDRDDLKWPGQMREYGAMPLTAPEGVMTVLPEPGASRDRHVAL